ncbi:MAG: hypothetical protein AVDCRST_MAG65-688, partial [uncultured Solirubrobacteraceae bacterium]
CATMGRPCPSRPASTSSPAPPPCCRWPPGCGGSSCRPGRPTRAGGSAWSPSRSASTSSPRSSSWASDSERPPSSTPTSSA